MSTKRNLAGRAGRWSAQHRKKAIFGWLAFVILAFAIGARVGTHTLTKQQAGVGESGRAATIVDGAYPHKAHESVLIQSRRLTSDTPAFRAAVDDVAARLAETDGVSRLRTPYGRGGRLSSDGHSALIAFEVQGKVKDAATTRTVEATLATVRAAAGTHPDLRIEQFGDVSSAKAFDKIIQSDLQKAEISSLPLTLLILLIAFGTMLAAGIPVLLAISAVVATFGLVGPLSQIAPVDDSIKNVILLIGLAVGVDYSLFYVRRVREEHAAGRQGNAAIEAAAATSGRAVLVSGVTVMISMAGMYLAGAATFTSFATGAITVVAVAMLGSLTVLPAVLSKVGARVDGRGIPGLRSLKQRTAEFGLWSRIVDRVLRRPLLSVVLSAGLLIALAVPAFGMHTGQPGTESLPKDTPVVRTFERVQAAFPSETSGMDVVVQAKDVTAPAVRGGIARFQHAVAQRHVLFPGTGASVDVNPDKTVAMLSIAVAGHGDSQQSDRALDVLRGTLVPSTLGLLSGVKAYVTGGKAAERDFNDTLGSHLPYVFAFVLTGSVHAAADHVPLAHHPNQGDHPEPAVRGRRLRRIGARLPERLVREPARIRHDGADRGMAAAVPLRDVVRALDGLPRVHPHSGARGVRQGNEHGGRGGPWGEEHGWRRHERCGHHGLRLLGVRDALADGFQAAGRRTRHCRLDRRDAHPGCPSAGVDEAPRGPQLVAAQIPAQDARPARAREVMPVKA